MHTSRDKTTSARRCWYPQHSRESCAEQTAFTGTTRSMVCRYPVSPCSGSPREDSSCRMHCKIMRGQLLGYSWDKQLLLQLPQAFTAKPVPRGAPFAVLNSSASQVTQGRTGCRESGHVGAASGFPLIFPSHGVSSTGPEDTQHLQYLLQGTAALSLLHRCWRDHIPTPTEQKQLLQGQLRGD